MRPHPIRRAPLLVVAGLVVAAWACGSPSSVDDREPEPHDFSLEVLVGRETIRDGGPLDADPEANRIVLRDVRPEAHDGHLLLDGVLIEVRPGEGRNRVDVAVTSTPDLAPGSAEISAGSGGPTPFMDVYMMVTADLRGFFAGEPSGYEATAHLDGSYLAVDDAGNARDGGPISHARSHFSGGVGVALREAVIGPVSAGLVQEEESPVSFSPDDVTRELVGGEVDGLQSELHLELGPGSGTHHPVSAVLTLRALRE